MINPKRKTIGRTLPTQTMSMVKPEQPNQPQIFTLASGDKVEFELKTVAADKLENETFVDAKINGRDQQALTPESLADITRTIPLQQFFPAIGRMVDGKIEILDGSRRRAAAMLTQRPLNILVTNSAISADNARQLAADIQTAKEHNIREVGQRLMLLRNDGMTQKEIAQSQNMSASKVTRAIQAATVPSDMLSLFSVQSELSYNDYKLLLDIATDFEKRKLDLVELILSVDEELDGSDQNITADERCQAVLKAYKQRSTQMIAKPKTNKGQLTTLKTFDDKNVFARKREKNRDFSYEFSRLPKSVQQELDKVIAETLDKFYP